MLFGAPKILITRNIYLFNVPSIKILRISLLMNNVDTMTITEKKSVQMGSAILHFSLYQMIPEAINTPTDCTRSPIT